MKIAIISDIHDNITNLKRFLLYAEKQGIEKCLCCGDLTSLDTAHRLIAAFKSLVIVRGNVELFESKAFENIENVRYFSDFGRVRLGGFVVGICHEPYKINKILESGKADMVCYGHTHKPWIEKRGETTVVNPGTLGGVFQRATFAEWEPDQGKLDLKLLSKIAI